MDLHPSAQSVSHTLIDLGSTAQPQMLPDSARTAHEAAETLGVAVAAIVKSLVFDCSGDPVMVLCSGTHHVDTGALAGSQQISPLRRAAPDFVRSVTGQTIGGVAPVGHPAAIRTFIDQSLSRYPQLWAAAGHPHAVFPTTFDELVKLTNGTPVDVHSP